ncbi:hypothetical protein BV22DRAFT_1019952 [Leucogyrophana mollusca]|uniref:Uncharacterized protein n=1 Tax=Leucogyrophana mollusca TaxID=85980 RepID=A0ACB8B6U2_9AGAM|nr:hypothetical protein BV22DRAFT_1019952 [Leucogyrophana mollusca]
MPAHAPQLARLFSPTFASIINAQIVYPAASQVVKPNELESALARPLQKAHYQPESSVAELAASLSYGIIKGHPFMDGNKRTGSLFFLANEYARARGLPGLTDGGKAGEVCGDVHELAERHIRVASGLIGEQALLTFKDEAS